MWSKDSSKIWSYFMPTPYFSVVAVSEVAVENIVESRSSYGLQLKHPPKIVGRSSFGRYLTLHRLFHRHSQTC